MADAGGTMQTGIIGFGHMEMNMAVSLIQAHDFWSDGPAGIAELLHKDGLTGESSEQRYSGR